MHAVVWAFALFDSEHVEQQMCDFKGAWLPYVLRKPFIFMWAWFKTRYQECRIGRCLSCSGGGSTMCSSAVREPLWMVAADKREVRFCLGLILPLRAVVVGGLEIFGLYVYNTVFSFSSCGYVCRSWWRGCRSGCNGDGLRPDIHAMVGVSNKCGFRQELLRVRLGNT